MSTIQGTKHVVKSAWLDFRAKRDLRQAVRYDYKRFVRDSSTTGPFGSQQNLAAKITERYHSVEKGLALPEPRPGFGAAAVLTLLKLVERYESEYGTDRVIAAAKGALATYVNFNLAHGLDEQQVPHFEAIKDVLNDASYPSGGTLDISRAEVLAAVKDVKLEFFTTRHSTRTFTPDPVNPEDIRFAAAAAATAPAVCNRQFGRVHVWLRPEEIERLVSIQEGARGFGQEIAALALITVSGRSYWGAGERNQAWIDGGLFAMNFMLGLHARGLGAVALNWSKRPKKDQEMLAAAGLAQSDRIIMLIGIGNLAGDYRVAASCRSVDPLVWHGE